MLKSMTGYGRADAVSRKYGRYQIELQGVNRKYCDIIINLPKPLLFLEAKVRELISDTVLRGRINVFVSYPKEGAACHTILIDTGLAKQYYQGMQKLRKELKIKGDIDLNFFAGLKEIITHTEAEVDLDEVWTILERGLKKALKEFDEMRVKEGGVVAGQLEKPIAEIEKRLREIEDTVPDSLNDFRQRLKKRIEEAGLNVVHADERIKQEIAVLAEHVDITEEINRMRSHLSQFRALFLKDGAVGRTLDFLCQEMIRETNTMGSKALYSEISTHVVFIKGELEKIREQVQNIE